MFSIQGSVLCLGPALLSAAGDARPKGSKHHLLKIHFFKTQTNQACLLSFTISHVKRPIYAISQKLILWQRWGRPMPQRMEKSLYKPNFRKLSNLQHVKSGERRELVADNHPIIWMTLGHSCPHTLPSAETIIRARQNLSNSENATGVLLFKVVPFWSSSHHTCAWVWLGWACGKKAHHALFQAVFPAIPGLYMAASVPHRPESKPPAGKKSCQKLLWLWLKGYYLLADHVHDQVSGTGVFLSYSRK